MKLSRIKNLHRDEHGAISLITVFTMLFFTFLLIMIVNVGKHIDDKVRMQNSVDAATYSSGVVLARGMNGIAFTNHLLCDVFAMTAYLREGRDRNAEQVVPMALAAWKEHGLKYPQTQFDKFPPLAPIFQPKAEQEQLAVTAFGDLMEAASEELLPVFEKILQEELIPKFQRDLLQTSPDLAQQMMMEISMRHGILDKNLTSLSGQLREGAGQQSASSRGNNYGVIWRTDVNAVNDTGENDPNTRTLPIVDVDPAQPDYGLISNASDLKARSFSTRHSLADNYRKQWVYDKLSLFDKEAKFSRFADLWNIATCGQLQLLEQEYPESNLPMMLREEDSNDSTDDYIFVGVNYRKHLTESGPKMFINQLNKTSDAQTYAQIELYLPRRMYMCCPWAWRTYTFDNLEDGWRLNVDRSPQTWNSFSQNWNIRMVPATDAHIQQILSSGNSRISGLRTSLFQNLSSQDYERLNTH